MKIIILSLQSLCLVVLMIQDLLHKSVSLWLFIAFAAITIAYSLVMPFDPFWALVIPIGVILIMIKGIILIKFKRENIANADIILVLLLLLNLYPNEVAWFMIVAGVIGIGFSMIWRIRYQDIQFPFFPPLVLAYAAILLFRVASL